MVDQSIAIVEHDGIKTKFAISNQRDYIQDIHMSGIFYELDQLIFHKSLIYRDCIVLDIGANVGNHTLFYCRHTPAVRIFPFEPNPAACLLLKQNTAQNDAAARVDLRYASLAVGSERASYVIDNSPPNNMGATSLKSGAAEAGTARIEGRRLDDLEFGDRVGFIKIDVEGMEMNVLDGAVGLFTHHRPYVAVEINARNEVPFWRWLDLMRYHVIGVFHAYSHNRNYIAIPRY